MHKEGRMKYVYEMVKNDYETEVFDDYPIDKSFDEFATDFSFWIEKWDF